ncbi:NUDIX domain-containing protein [Rarobacter incanus]|uniref:ADP-ribose pyrophosphatase n=1 Tax=Rarobacter incanus TaxID=153494 RepID=A0A542SLQ7_9MICO|nr:NUDIX hydrolase [Rarobacter incanus]TQK75552.1 ADP-ribose pyrophosphatase [Rarobacter incanus]
MSASVDLVGGGTADLRDEVHHAPVLERDLIYRGHVWNLVSDVIDLGEGGRVRRDVVDHPGAVAIVALDEQDRMLVIQQYRHPAQRKLWEIPAGLMDHPGEDPLAAARRELMEEADVSADMWHVLVDMYTSPGGSTEPIRVFLARGLSEVPVADRYQRGEEELGMARGWVGLADAAAAILRGDIHNPSITVGVLAAVASRAGGWASLRPADAPWPEQIRTRLVAG